MQFSFDLNSLKDPKKRMLLGIILLAVGLACIIGNNWKDTVSRDECVTVEATFDDCKFRSLDGAIDSNNIYLTFKDYSTDLDIHSSCANDELTEDLMDLRSGTKMKLVVDEKTKRIYEIIVRDKKWMSFEESVENIKGNLKTMLYLGYVALAAGAIFLLSGVIPFLLGKKSKTE